MAGLFTMAKKEFLDIIGEKKFLLIFATLLIVVLVSTFEGGLSYSSSQSSTTTVVTGNSTRPGGGGGGGGGFEAFGSAQSLSRSLSSMITNFSLVGGVLAIAISFDTINNERQKGSLKTLLSYPIYRDSIDPAGFLDASIAANYPSRDYHTMYFGEVMAARGKAEHAGK